MRVVVDTNVVAYYLLKTEPFYEEARGFELADRESIPLATFDQKVLDRFGEIAKRPAALLG